MIDKNTNIIELINYLKYSSIDKIIIEKDKIILNSVDITLKDDLNHYIKQVIRFDEIEHTAGENITYVLTQMIDRLANFKEDANVSNMP